MTSKMILIAWIAKTNDKFHSDIITEKGLHKGA